MERLTKRLNDGKTVMDCDSCEQKKDKQCTFYECRASLIKRLAAYEDTGLTPEEVTAVKLALMGKTLAEITEFEGVPLDRLRKLAVCGGRAMERLTYFKDGYWRVNISGVQYQADFVDRLAAYEDIAELCGGFDRLRELAEADKDGRVVVLPCKVYETDGVRVYEHAVRGIIYRTAGGPDFDESTIGKSIFLTREEAERAMEGRKEMFDNANSELHDEA